MPTYWVWCLYSSFVHGLTKLFLKITNIPAIPAEWVLWSRPDGWPSCSRCWQQQCLFLWRLLWKTQWIGPEWCWSSRTEPRKRWAGCLQQRARVFLNRSVERDCVTRWSFFFEGQRNKISTVLFECALKVVKNLNFYLLLWNYLLIQKFFQ